MKKTGPANISIGILGFASIAEGILALTAVYWLNHLDPDWWSVFLPNFSIVKSILFSMGIAVVCQFFGLAIYYFVPSYHRTVLEIMMPIFERMNLLSIAYLALLAGIGEEIFFRAFLQPLLGLFFTSIIFALLHCGLKRDLFAYGLFAFVVSLVLGYIFNYSGSLFIPIASHFFIDFLGGILLWQKMFH